MKSIPTAQRLILVDCDGVLLDWEPIFAVWMQDRGFVRHANAKGYYKISDQFHGVDADQAKKFTRLFNESASIAFLPPFRDSAYWVRRINQELGYRFHVITSLSRDESAVRLRQMNLHNCFGDVFDGITCLDTGSDKHQALELYRDSGLLWVEDKPENTDVGHDMGLASVLLEHEHNASHLCPYPRVKTWREIYQIILDRDLKQHL
jgi:FMN phosphatase YigB (HAD superfamily)